MQYINFDDGESYNLRYWLYFQAGYYVEDTSCYFESRVDFSIYYKFNYLKADKNVLENSSR